MVVEKKRLNTGRFFDNHYKDDLKGIYVRATCVPFGQECLIPNMDAPEVSPDIEKEGD